MNESTVTASLFDKQIEAYEYLINPDFDGEVLYGGAARGGKAQPLDALICTPEGFRQMGTLKIGDVISHPNGSNSRIIAIHPQGFKEVYRLVFSDGTATKACSDHLWRYWIGHEQNKKGVKGLGNERIAQTTDILKLIEKGKSIQIPLTEPVQFTIPHNKSHNIHKIDAYVLGVLLGDGSLTQNVCFTSADQEIVEKVQSKAPKGYKVNKLKSEYSYSITYNQRNSKGHPINPLAELISKLGLNCKSECKFIPEYYFTSSIETRFNLIKGLFDTDGTVDQGGQSYYCSSSERLAKDVRRLLLSLGFKVTITKKKTKVLDTYILYVNGLNTIELFSLERKRAKVKKLICKGKKLFSIEKIGLEDCQCITVDSLDGLYITDDYIVTHNSYLGCTLLTHLSLRYPESQWLIGFEELKHLRRTTLPDLIKIIDENLRQLRDDPKTLYNINLQDMVIQFYNGSKIFLSELATLPSDPLFDRLGSYSLTGFWIDEAQRVDKLAIDTLKGRLSLTSSTKHNWQFKPKKFYTCNPRKNWIYNDFYLPLIKGGLVMPEKKFIISLYTDNPYIDHESYKKQIIETGNKVQIERLLYGNFEYDDDPSRMIEYDKILDLWSNHFVKRTGKLYISADIARFGNDKTVICVWDGFCLISFKVILKSDLVEVQNTIISLQKQYSIPASCTIVDADGLGAGVKDNLRCLGFSANNKPFNSIYRNLKAECYYELAKLINEGKMYIQDNLFKSEIVQELEQVKIKNQDKDGKLEIVGKDDVKASLGRSPDFSDAIMLRCYFELSQSKKTTPSFSFITNRVPEVQATLADFLGI